MFEIIEIADENRKACITEEILHKLPSWFGIESAIDMYVNDVRNKKFYAALVKGNIIGFLALRHINPYTSELYLMGVLEEFHRQKVGSALLEVSEDYLKKNNVQLFMVKTLGESSYDPSYAKTRAFYFSKGFFPLEEIKEIWNEDNPCLIMVKPLSR